MQFKNKAKWEEGLKRNADGRIDDYNGGIYFFAELWALLMEAALVEEGGPEKTVASVADDASRRADDAMWRSVTNFQYLEAVSVLGECWKYGNDLTLWHHINAALYKGETADEQAKRLFTDCAQPDCGPPEIQKEEPVIIKRGREFI